jgi:hypothetical protein
MPLIGNKVTEKDIRDYLTANGYYGRSAVVRDLKLTAVQRPGWIQVFQFEVRAKSVEDGWHELFGTCRDDESAEEFNVFLSPNQSERDEQASAWSEGLLTTAKRERHWIEVALLGLFVAVMSLAIFGAIAGGQ